MSNNMLCNLWQWWVVSCKPNICARGRQRAEENGFRELSVFSSPAFCTMKTLPKAQRTLGIEYFDSFNTSSSKQKFQQALKSWSNFSLVLFGREREIHRTTLTNPCNKLNNSIKPI